ncbi:hypothetical protein ACPA9J_14220 [Pseudomonas aeruginosa]
MPAISHSLGGFTRLFRAAAGPGQVVAAILGGRHQYPLRRRRPEAIRANLTFGNLSSSVGGAAFAFLPDVPDALKGQSWYLINSSYSANVNPAQAAPGRARR